MRNSLKSRFPMLAVATLLAGFALAGPSMAEEACQGFKWPVDTELGWLKANDHLQLKSGAEIDPLPTRAIALELEPAKDVKMPVAPGVKPQAIGAGTFSGWFTLPASVKPGIYQVSLSTNGWIDAAQNGQLIRSSGFSGRRGCELNSQERALRARRRSGYGTDQRRPQANGAGNLQGGRITWMSHGRRTSCGASAREFSASRGYEGRVSAADENKAAPQPEVQGIRDNTGRAIE